MFTKKPELPLRDVEKSLMLDNPAYKYDSLTYMRMMRTKLMFNYSQHSESGVFYLDPSAMIETDVEEFGVKRRENVSERAEYIKYTGNGLIQNERVAFVLAGPEKTNTRKLWGGDTVTSIEFSRPLVMFDYTPDAQNGTARIDKIYVNGRKTKLTEANARRVLSLAHYCLQEMTMNGRLPFQKAKTLIFGTKRNKQMALAKPRP